MLGTVKTTKNTRITEQAAFATHYREGEHTPQGMWGAESATKGLL